MQRGKGRVPCKCACIASGDCRSVGRPTLFAKVAFLAAGQNAEVVYLYLVPLSPPVHPILRCENPRNKQRKWSQLYGQACPLCPACVQYARAVSSDESDLRRVDKSKGFQFCHFDRLWKRASYQDHGADNQPKTMDSSTNLCLRAVGETLLSTPQKIIRGREIWSREIEARSGVRANFHEVSKSPFGDNF